MPTLLFKGKSAIETYHHTVPHHRLEFVPQSSVLSEGQQPGLDGSLVIEGGNLPALKSLLPTHAGRIHCVYIDPPYNTGHEDWVYNDNLSQPQFKEWIGETVGKEGEDASRHDKWCCMMYPRLTLLKELLREDGAIFVSIDDNELMNLLHLLSEIFGIENRLGLIIVEMNPRGRRLGTELAVEHEYVAAWAKDISRFTAGRLPLNDGQIEQYPEIDESGRRFRLLGLRKRGALSRREDRPNLHYPIFIEPDTGEVHLKPAPQRVKVVPKRADGTDGVWRWQASTVKREHERLVAKQVRRKRSRALQWDIFERDYATDEHGRPRSRLFGTIWQGSEFNNETGRDQIRELFGDAVFNYPKPVGLVKQILRLGAPANGFVLDAFAGSGTTGQAVVELNEEDGGRRRVVLVQQPFDTADGASTGVNICREVTAERLKRVIDRRRRQGGNSHEAGGPGASFTYVRLGDPLFGEYRDLGETLPSFEDLAKYIFYTETGRECDLASTDRRIGFVGATEADGGTSYYLLYAPDPETDREISLTTLEALAKTDTGRNWVIYAEKIWLHPQELGHFERVHGKRVRIMRVPFDLK